MLEPILCGPVSRAPLLPKLRGHFAEFLNDASPVGLRILSSPTCVGLRYGRTPRNSGFSWHPFPALRYYASLVLRRPGFAEGFSFPGSLLLPASPHVLIRISAGISTCCPSTTPLGLALGPDFPRADQLYPGILGYSAWRILTSISLLIPAFSLLNAPPLFSVRFLRRLECSPTDQYYP